ncbi:MAG: HEAT repeat domain-containing protein [Spirochaetales bacterium]|jgi:hypothetical protein|nr:HEAT repeat domain-containing protein [Spirochaetales bacterium]
MSRQKNVLLLFLFLLPMVLFAQEGAKGEATVEELFLKNAEIRVLREQAITVDRDIKLLALQGIQEMIDEGKISSGDPEAHYILDYLSTEGIGTAVLENRRLINYFPEVRRKSCELLGRLGGERSVSSLIRVLADEDETMVLSEAVYALGEIGTNENNSTSQAISAAVIAQDTVRPDDNFAFAALLAFEKLAKKTGSLSDTSVFSAIIRIAQGNYIRPVRQKANELLIALRKLNE